MHTWIPKNQRRLISHLREPLLKNAITLILTSVSSAGFGFIFWMLTAKLYPETDVGIASALISSISLLVLLSRFGLDFSIIRFFPTNDRSRIFSTSVIATTFFAVIFGAIFIASVDVFSPELHLLKSPQNAMFFLLVLAVNSVIVLTGTSFIAIRKTEFYLIQNVILGSKIFFIIPLAAFGAVGIFGAIGISFILALLVALVILMRLGIRPMFVVDRSFLNETFHFSVGNYLAGTFMTAPNMILPIMALNMLGSEKLAYYYIVFAITSLLFMIPISIGTSLFVEGSHGEALKKTVLKSLAAAFSLLIPAVFILYLGGGWLLNIIGESYSENGLELLRIMVFASFFMAVTSIYFSVKRIQKDVKGLVILSGVIFVLLVGLGYMFMLTFGMVGLGYAWVVSYGFSAVIVGVIACKEVWQGWWI